MTDCSCNNAPRCQCNCGGNERLVLVQGPQGPAGPCGPIGPQGPAGGLLGFADFYDLLVGNNTTNVDPGEDVPFPSDGINSGAVVRASDSSFTLTEIGAYYVGFQVSVQGTGQLVLTLNGTVVPSSIVGHNGTDQLIGMSIVETTTANTVLTLRNPADSNVNVNISAPTDQNSGSSHLVILRLS
ncbi:MAG: collagen-like protein [Clostridia bacterium]|nr:collagen-like protein [Clostridia bacterium]